VNTLLRRHRPYRYTGMYKRDGNHYSVVIQDIPVAFGYGRTVPGAARRARRSLAEYLGLKPRQIHIVIKRRVQ
jgi:hypothetical protein